MNSITNISTDWLYLDSYEGDYVKPSFDDSKWIEVNVPHTLKEIPYNYFDEKVYQIVATYRKHLVLGDIENKSVRLVFEGVGNYADVYLNGQYITSHKGAYGEFVVDISKYAHEGDNVLAVVVDGRERSDIPPFGFVVDYLCYGGIYREVSLVVSDTTYISDVQTIPTIVGDKAKVLFNVSTIGEDTGATATISFAGEIVDEVTGNIVGGVGVLSTEIEGINLWDLSAPNLYDIKVTLSNGDTYEFRYGFRTAEFRVDGFYLNGRRVHLMGLNRHQAYPYVGYAMPKNAQVMDADLLKANGLNIVRTSHYMQSRHFLTRCDEIGLLVLEEIPGWQHIGDSEWQEVAIQNVREMITRDRNHPSIVLWGVRINESRDNHDLYTKTNALAHSLDSTRQTGGIRCIDHSELLEDVYTSNDFTFLDNPEPLPDMRARTGLDHDVPYLVTEYMGHMWPTKAYDNEMRAATQARRHAEIQDKTMGSTRAGAIGWCAFDYNTHLMFGSGDKICHHGVMDMFRNPKTAVCAYRSQKSPKDEIVLEPTSIWARGEIDGGIVGPYEVYTNCDYITMTINRQATTTHYPDREHYKYLPHPPVIIPKLSNVWGDSWDEVEYVGYIDGKAVITKKYSQYHIAKCLVGEVVFDEIEVNDVSYIRVKAVDDMGQVMRYFNEAISIDVEGAGTLVGPQNVVLYGGMYGFYVRSNKLGDIKVTISNSRLGQLKYTIKVK